MKFHDQFEVSCLDVDENDHIRPTGLLRYLQDTADHQMRDRKPSYAEFFAEGKAFIVTRMSIEIFAQLHQYDKIDTYTWACDAKMATFPRCYEVYRGEELVAKVYSEWAVVNHETGHLYRASEIDISGYERDEALSMESPKRYRFPKTLSFQHVGDRHVYYSDCDMNRHMNNGNYFNLLWERIPDVMNQEVTSMNIRFQHEAGLDSDISIGMAKLEENLVSDSRAEELYAFRTMVDGKTNVECIFGVRSVNR